MTRSALLSLFVLLFVLNSANATHLRSGEISVQQEMVNSLTVKITITVYTNTINTNVMFGGEDDFLDFGDGTRIPLPYVNNTLRWELGAGIASASFVVYHIYPKMGNYLVSYTEPNRNTGVINMDNSDQTRFYLETMVMLVPGSLYSTPTSIVLPIHYAVRGTNFSVSLGYTDGLGNRLLYDKVIPKGERDVNVTNYRYPENYTIDRYTGTITWDTKFQGAELLGEYGFAARISQVTPEGKLAGYVVRDFQIIVTEGDAPTVTDNQNLDQHNRLYFPTGQSKVIKAIAQAPNGAEVTLTATSELSPIATAFEFSTYDSTDNAGKTLKVGKLKLTNSFVIKRATPYPITIRASTKEHELFLVNDITYLFFTQDDPTEVPGNPVVGILPQRTQSLAVYPNPFADRLSIESGFSANATIVITDARGRKVHECELSNGSVDLSELVPGVYFVMVSEGGRRSTASVLKK